jgi:TRAP-type C4-dicarboxylate transport system substrate-binding protein
MEGFFKKTMLLVLLSAVIAGLSACGGSNNVSENNDSGEENTSASSEKAIVFSFSSNLPTGNQIEQAFTDVNAMIANGSGTMEIEYYPGATLLSDSEVWEGVQSGVADMGYLNLGFEPGQFPYGQLFETAGIRWATAQAASYAFREFLQTFEGITEFDNVVILAAYCSGPGQIEATKPIHTLEDIKGLKLRATSTIAPAVQRLGATPLTISFGDVYESMRTGVIDGWVGVIGAIGQMKFYEVAPYILYYPYFNTANLLIMNKDVFNALSSDQQEELLSAFAKENVDYLDLTLQTLDDTGIKGFAGLKERNFLTEEEAKRWDAALSPIIEEYAKDLDAAGLRGTEALAYMRELAEKYNAEYPTNEQLESYFDEEFLAQYK